MSASPVSTTSGEHIDFENQCRELHAILDRLPQGMIVFNEELRVETCHSTRARVLLGHTVLEGKTLDELVFRGARDLSEERRSMCLSALMFSFGVPEFMAEANQEHLIENVERRDADGQTQHLGLEWVMLTGADGETVERVLLTIRDETHARQAQQAATRRARELELLHQLITAGLREFQEFSYNTRQRINDNAMLCDEEILLDDGVLEQMFRNLHTIKGNARLLDFEQIALRAHLAEEPVRWLQSQPPDLLDDMTVVTVCLQIEERLFALLDSVKEYEEVLACHFPEFLENVHTIDPRVLELVRAEVVRAREDMSLSQEAIKAIHMLLSNTKAMSLRHVVQKVSRVFASLARELEKPEPEVEVSGCSVWMTYGFGSTLQDALMHIFRNAFDHGIEAPGERSARGKAERGKITITSHESEQGMVLTIRDDGKGLDLAMLRERIAGGEHLSDQELAQGIFGSGVSTARTLTTISGRGVGMDVVRTFLEQRHCAVEIVLCEGEAMGTHRPFELVLTIPHSELVEMR